MSSPFEPDAKPAEAGLAAAEIEKLLGLHPKGFDLSLDRISALLEKLGNPQDKLPPVIHIAGTNGKGSCTAFCRALLEAEGLRVHVHTSPHLVNWHERYRLVGSLVDDATLADAVRRVAHANAGTHITVFEILTAVMFVLFAEHPADAAIVEVGLGGRGDATNVIKKPAASVIMPIGMDHEAYLGDTVEKIAAEKGGIIKSGVPLVIGAQPHEAARQILQGIAEKRRAPTMTYGQDFLAYAEMGRLIYQDETGLLDLPLPALAGRHQYSNAAAAIAAVRAAGFDISDAAIEKAMKTVEWPARMQRLEKGPLTALGPQGAEYWLDGGHNPDGAIVVTEFLAECEETAERPLFMVTGMINTKDAIGYFKPFEGLVRHVFCVPVPSSDAGVPPELLAQKAQLAGLSAEPMDSVADALALLGESWNGLEMPPRILISGSLYLAGDVLRDNGTPPK